MASASAEGVATLESLLFKATSPTNRIDDVNTIKLFCDAVSTTPDGPAVACRLLAHKVQSPQDREAVQSLAVLEACVKSCGTAFHAEVGKFKFLNELIKLVSPKYLGPRTPEHIKKKVVELLFVWTREIKEETKIGEAYVMLKKQGVVTEDPTYVGEAVFAAGLKPRSTPPLLTAEQTQTLKKLLQSKNADDLQKANQIIKGMVHEDERKMDALSRRCTELVMVNNNAKLLSEMLDHFDRANSAQEELDLCKELFESCEKMQAKLFRMAADTEENDDSIGEILAASDELSRVVDRYKMVIVQGKPDIAKRRAYDDAAAESLLDLNPAAPGHQAAASAQLIDDDMLGLDTAFQTLNAAAPVAPSSSSTIDDLLLNGCPLISSAAPTLLTSALPASIPARTATSPTGSSTWSTKLDEQKASRQRGLHELDLLGENAIKSHLPSKSPEFAKKNEKVSMNALAQKKFSNGDSEQRQVFAAAQQQPDQKPPEPLPPQPPLVTPQPVSSPSVSSHISTVTAASTTSSVDVKLSDLEVPLSSIRPGPLPPLTLQDSSDGVSIVLHFGKDSPREHVTAIVVTMMNKSGDRLTDLELKAVVPRGCRVKLQPASGSELPPHNPFVPPPAVTQVMLVANPNKITVGLKYVLSYLQNGEEPQTEMGEVAKLPIE